MKLNYILSLLFALSVNAMLAQDTLSIKEIYFKNNLTYENSNDALFTGVAQKLRKNGNGHIVSEEIYSQGVILEWRSYFNKSNKRLAQKVLYYKDYPLIPKEKIEYTSNKNGKFIERTFYDIEKMKTLITRHRDTSLVYMCTYKNGKKNGKEFCYSDDGKPIVIEFSKGRKVKE